MVRSCSPPATETTALFWIGVVIGGAGFGVAFLGGLRALSAAIPPQHRAEVMSAFYIVAYLAISLPAILAGVLVHAARAGDDVRDLRLVVAALALAVAFEAWRTRPAPARLAIEWPSARRSPTHASSVSHQPNSHSIRASCAVRELRGGHVPELDVDRRAARGSSRQTSPKPSGKP